MSNLPENDKDVHLAWDALEPAPNYLVVNSRTSVVISVGPGVPDRWVGMACVAYHSLDLDETGVGPRDIHRALVRASDVCALVPVVTGDVKSEIDNARAAIAEIERIAGFHR